MHIFSLYLPFGQVFYMLLKTCEANGWKVVTYGEIRILLLLYSYRIICWALRHCADDDLLLEPKLLQWQWGHILSYLLQVPTSLRAGTMPSNYSQQLLGQKVTTKLTSNVCDNEILHFSFMGIPKMTLTLTFTFECDQWNIDSVFMSSQVSKDIQLDAFRCYFELWPYLTARRVCKPAVPLLCGLPGLGCCSQKVVIIKATINTRLWD